MKNPRVPTTPQTTPIASIIHSILFKIALQPIIALYAVFAIPRCSYLLNGKLLADAALVDYQRTAHAPSIILLNPRDGISFLA
ncbi:MAG: hypothetical protein KGN01_06520 [Patescibacteria group bacterium]|nr:hypothetical protein [Patescibacteria group bacterium]